MFEEIIENAYYPMTLSSGQGTLAVPDDIEFRPEDYSFHPLMNGAVVLALPHASGEASGALCHLFTRQVWTRSPAPAEPDRESPSGVVWYHHPTEKRKDLGEDPQKRRTGLPRRPVGTGSAGEPQEIARDHQSPSTGGA